MFNSLLSKILPQRRPAALVTEIRFARPRAVLRHTPGAIAIADERARQIHGEKFDAERDDAYTDEQLARAARCYWAFVEDQLRIRSFVEANVYFRTRSTLADWWPWDLAWWKPSEDPARNLAKAGALFWAEADRWQRMGIEGDDRQAMFRRKEYLKAVQWCDRCVDAIDALPAKGGAK